MNELYELPKGWEWRKLGEIADLQNGYAFKSKLFVDNGLKIIKITNLKNGVLDISDCNKFKKEDYNNINLDKFIIRKDDILVAMTGEPKVSISQYTEELYLNQRVGKINVKSNMSKFYILYFLHLSFEKIFEKAIGAAQKNLSNKQINDINVPLPSLAEQKRIVEKLDKLFERIDKSISLLQKNIDDSESFMKSVLNDVFEDLEGKYKKEKLENIVKIIGGGTPSKKEKEYWENGTIKWATVGDMNVETIFNTELLITEKGLKKSSSNIIPKEAIVIATRVGLGKVCYLSEDIAINQDLKGLLALNNKLNIRFLFNFFKHIEKYIISNGIGATVKGVRLDFIKNLDIPLPPINIQKKVVKYLDEISQKVEKLEKVQKEKMENLKALKASILDKAFKGEL